MSSFTYHFRPSVRQGRHRGTVFIRIIHNRRSFCLSTGLRVYPEEWDPYSRTVIVPHPTSKRFAGIKEIKEALDTGMAEFDRTLSVLSVRGVYGIEDIRDAYRSRRHSLSLADIVDTLTAEMRAGQPRTAKAYISLVRSIDSFTDGHGVRLSRIDRRFVESYERFLKEKRLKPNTVSFYMRNLRAVINKAVARHLMPRPAGNLFSGVFTGISRTEKRALDAAQVRQLQVLDPALFNFRFRRKTGLSPELRDSLGMFMFCFYAQGMSFVDMAYLRKKDIEDGVIRYRRKKTGQLIEVATCPEMKSIIHYFALRTRRSQYLFPVVSESGAAGRLQYESALRLQNLRLKKLGLLSPSAGKLSTHASRHSWATIAKNENIGISVISEALGHNSESTTRIYLDCFKQKLLKQANEMIRRAIKKAV